MCQSEGSLPAHGIFITGTCTDVGKTYVACLLARAWTEAGVTVGAYKPAATGGRSDAGRVVCDDVEQLRSAINAAGGLHEICPQQFLQPLAPHVAAAAEGRTIDERLLVQGATGWRERCDVLIVEGAGGILSPLGPTMSNLDVAVALGYPVVVVADNELGVINRARLTLLATQALPAPLAVLGIILNQRSPRYDSSRSTNAAELARLIQVPILLDIGYDAADVAKGDALAVLRILRDKKRWTKIS